MNTADLQGNTPLHFAARADEDRAIEALIENGANVNAVNQNGTTPLHAASIAGKSPKMNASSVLH